MVVTSHLRVEMLISSMIFYGTVGSDPVWSQTQWEVEPQVFGM